MRHCNLNGFWNGSQLLVTVTQTNTDGREGERNERYFGLWTRSTPLQNSKFARSTAYTVVAHSMMAYHTGPGQLQESYDRMAQFANFNLDKIKLL